MSPCCCVSVSPSRTNIAPWPWCCPPLPETNRDSSAGPRRVHIHPDIELERTCASRGDLHTFTSLDEWLKARTHVKGRFPRAAPSLLPLDAAQPMFSSRGGDGFVRRHPEGAPRMDAEPIMTSSWQRQDRESTSLQSRGGACRGGNGILTYCCTLVGVTAVVEAVQQWLVTSARYLTLQRYGSNLDLV